MALKADREEAAVVFASESNTVCLATISTLKACDARLVAFRKIILTSMLAALTPEEAANPALNALMLKAAGSPLILKVTVTVTVNVGGAAVGAGVGPAEGAEVGAAEGAEVGPAEGAEVGAAEGVLVGLGVEAPVDEEETVAPVAFPVVAIPMVAPAVVFPVVAIPTVTDAPVIFPGFAVVEPPIVAIPTVPVVFPDMVMPIVTVAAGLLMVQLGYPEYPPAQEAQLSMGLYPSAHIQNPSPLHCPWLLHFFTESHTVSQPG